MASKGKQRAGIQSLELGIHVLQTIAALSGRATLGQIAKKAGMPPSNVHRYLVSLVRSGVASQASSGEYEFGPLLRTLGLAALQHQDPYRTMFAHVRDVGDRTGLTVLLAVWVEGGVRIIAWRSGARVLPVTFRLGSTLSLTQSATGRVFLAHLPAATTAPIVRNSRRIAGAKAIDAADLAERVDQIRNSGFSHSSSEIIPEVDAFAAPIFEHEGNIIGVLTLLAATPEITPSSQAKIEKTLLTAAENLSRALGYLGPHL